MKLNLDIHKHDPADVITISHGGGVSENGAHPDSRAAISQAVRRGYDMVELDIVPTLDHHPVLVDSAWWISEDDRPDPVCVTTFHDKTLAEGEQERHPENGEAVLTLDAGLELCRGDVGVMLNFRMEDTSDFFYDRVIEAIEGHGFAGKALTVSKWIPKVRERLEEHVLFSMGPQDLDELAAKWVLEPKYFGFAVPDYQPGAWVDEDSHKGLAEADVSKLHEYDLAVIVAINKAWYCQTYPDAPETHLERVKKDIARFRAAGVDGFEIDSVYDSLLFAECAA